MRFLSTALTALAVAALGLFLVLAALRFGYPFELEWMEGGMLQHVERVLAGKPLFVEPSLDFMAFPYTPLFTYLGALLAIPMGADFQTLRLISVVSTLVCFVLLFRIVKRETGSARGGLVAAGLFAAAYDFGGAWYDVARVDMLSLALVLAGVALARGRAGRAAPVRAGVLLFLALLAKQSALGPAVGVLAALAVRDRRLGLRFALAFLIPALASVLILDRLSDGWFRWHVFELLAGHPRHAPAVLGFWIETARGLGIAFAVSLAWGLFSSASPAARRDPFFAIVAASLVLTAWIGRMHVGGYDNTLIPAALAASLLAGLAFGRIAGHRQDVDRHTWARPELAAALLVVQFGLLAFDPRTKVPTADDREAGERIVAALGEVEGEVWVPSHGYLARRAGHAYGAHNMAVMDLLRGPDLETAQRLVEELVGALAAQRYRWIVLDDLTWEQELAPLTVHYRRTGTLLDPAAPDVFAPRTGEKLRPVYLYEPRGLGR